MKDVLNSVLIALVAGIIAGAVVLHFSGSNTVTKIVTGSAVGTTFSTAKTAMINWAPTSNTASTTSILNGDASDRIIKSVNYNCSGSVFTSGNTLANVIFQAATTSVANLGIQSNPNIVFYNTLSTSTNAWQYVASSTQAEQNSEIRRWAAGSYLTFVTNATSTGLSCTIGADYFGT